MLKIINGAIKTYIRELTVSCHKTFIASGSLNQHTLLQGYLVISSKIRNINNFDLAIHLVNICTQSEEHFCPIPSCQLSCWKQPELPICEGCIYMLWYITIHGDSFPCVERVKILVYTMYIRITYYIIIEYRPCLDYFCYNPEH